MLRALILAAVALGAAVQGRNIQHHDATARVLHRTLAEAPTPSNATVNITSWPYGKCNFLLQDVDIVVLPPPPGNRAGNLANLPAAGPGVCCSKCGESRPAAEAAYLSAIKNLKDPWSSLLKLEGKCLGWTFVPGPPGGNGTCYLKNAYNVQRTRDLQAAVKANDEAKALSLLKGTPAYYWGTEVRNETKGWYSGTLELPALAGTEYDSQDEQVRNSVTVLYSEPLPSNTTGCTNAANQKLYSCQKVLGKLKST